MMETLVGINWSELTIGVAALVVLLLVVLFFIRTSFQKDDKYLTIFSSMNTTISDLTNVVRNNNRIMEKNNEIMLEIKQKIK